MTFRSILLVGSLLVLSAVSMAAETVHLYLKTSVQGTIRGSKSEVSIETLEVKSPRDAASGLATGKSKGKRKQTQSITLQLPVGEVGQQIFKALCNNEVITECKVEMKDPSGKMRMGTLVSPLLMQVSVVRKGTSATAYEVYQDVQIVYEKITWLK